LQHLFKAAFKTSEMIGKCLPQGIAKLCLHEFLLSRLEGKIVSPGIADGFFGAKPSRTHTYPSTEKILLFP
jgi:hypothetical protein